MSQRLHFNSENVVHEENADGHYLLFPNGLQICWNTDIRLTQDSSVVLGGTWNFPRAFDGEPDAVLCTRQPERDIAGFTNNTVGPWCSSVSATSAGFTLGRYSGTTNYSSGNFWDVCAVALGGAPLTRGTLEMLKHWNNENVELGSNADGEFMVFPNGIQICWGVVQATHGASTAIWGTWTYPRNFASRPAVIGTRTEDFDINPFRNNTPGPWMDEFSETEAQMVISRASGTADFQSGDWWDVDVVAIGEAQ